MSELPEDINEFDRQLNEHPDVKELRKQLSGDLKQMVVTVAMLTGKIRDIWPTIEGADDIPALPLVVYQIVETLKQDMCVLVMDAIEPGWEDKARQQMDAVLDILKVLTDKEVLTEERPTIH